jgi:hypothetical protein
MPTTPAGLPYPLDTDPVANGALDIQNLAESVDQKLLTTGVAWLPFTPNFRPDTGIWFVAPTNTGTYGRIGRIIFGQAKLLITSSGSAGGFISFDVPVPALQGNPQTIGACREANITGNLCSVQLNSTGVAQIRTFNNGATANGNFFYQLFFMYEAA